MAVIGDLVVKLKGDNLDLKKSLEESKKASESLVSGINSVKTAAVFAAATASIAFFTIAINDAVESMDELKNRALETATSVEDLQKLEFISGQSGLGADALTRALVKMQVSIGNNSEAFKKLNVDADSLRGMSSIDQIQKVGQAILRIGDIESRQAASREIFGRNASQLNQVFIADTNQLLAVYKDLGLGITDSQAEQAKGYKDQQEQIAAVWNTFKEEIASKALPGFIAITNGILNQVKAWGGVKEIVTNVGETITVVMSTALAPINATVRAVRDLKNAFLEVAEAAKSALPTQQNPTVFSTGRASALGVENQIQIGGVSNFRSTIPGVYDNLVSAIASMRSGSLSTFNAPEFSQDFNQALEKGTNAINIHNKALMSAAESLEKAQLSLGRSQLDRILNTNADGTAIQQASSLKFDNLARDIFNNTRSQADLIATIGSTAVNLVELQSIADSARNRGESTKNMEAVIAALNEEVNRALGQEAPKASISIELSDGLKAEFAQQQTQVAIEIVKKQMRETAQTYGSR